MGKRLYDTFVLSMQNSRTQAKFKLERWVLRYRANDPL